MANSIVPLAIAIFLFTAACSEQGTPPSSSTSNSAIEANISAGSATADIPAKIELDRLFVFESPDTCGLGDAGYRTIQSLIKLPGDGRILPGTFQAPPAFRAAFGDPAFEQVASDYHRASLPVSATWHGLRLTGLESGFIGNDGTYFDFIFDEPFEKVRSTLNGLGFKLDRSGSQGDPPMEGFEAKLSVRDGRTILSCSR